MAAAGPLRRTGVNDDPLRNGARMLMARPVAGGHASPWGASLSSSPARTAPNSFAGSARAGSAKVQAPASSAADNAAGRADSVGMSRSATAIPETAEEAIANGWMPMQRSVGLQEALLRKYGSIVGAWRALDPLQHGRLSLLDFCRVSQQLGYIVDAQSLWKLLDVNKDGFLTLEEIDPDVGALLRGFSVFLRRTCKSAERAWRKYFGDSCAGRCSHERFVWAARGLGFEGDVDAVFNALNADDMVQGISFRDFRLLDKWFAGVKGKPTDKPRRWHFERLRPHSTGDLRAVGMPRSV